MRVLFGGNFTYELNLFTQDVTKYTKIIAERWNRDLMRSILGVHGSQQHASFKVGLFILMLNPSNARFDRNHTCYDIHFLRLLTLLPLTKDENLTG